MRVLFCKIHCPSFTCFYKRCAAAAAHLYTCGGPLKLENTPHLPSTSASTVVSVTDTSDQLSAQVTEVKEFSSAGNVLKSCIRKVSTESGAPKEVEKKKVRWMDDLGKELVEITKFESSDIGDSDNDLENRGCVCIIL